MQAIFHRIVCAAGTAIVLMVPVSSIYAAMFDLELDYEGDNVYVDSNTETSASGTLTDANGNVVGVTYSISNDGRDLLETTSSIAAFSEDASDDDADGDSRYLGLSGGTPRHTRGEVIYHFEAPEGETFQGDFIISPQFAAVQQLSDSNGATRVFANFDGTSEWGDPLAEVTAPNGSNGDANIYDFLTDGPLVVDAAGQTDVYVRLVLASSYYNHTTQFHYVRFEGATVPIPEPGSMALVVLGSTLVMFGRRRR